MNEKYLEQLRNLTAAEPKPFLATRVKAAYEANRNQTSKQDAPVKWVSWAAAAMLVVNMFLWWNNSNPSSGEALDNEDAVVSLEGYNEFSNFYDNDK